MCGIAGALMLSGPGRVEAASLSRMAAAMRHRGPDDMQVWVGDGGALGLTATRLAITDPSPAGRQPMASEDGTFRLVFNGEVYNHAALRRELREAGDCFRSTTSDTEVLLRGLIRWGEDCVPRLRGMFAFAFWDGHRRELLLGRDPFGIKPLFYASGVDRFLFASECGALLSSGLVDDAVCPAAVNDWLTFLAVPAPRTLFRAISKLEAGTTLRLVPGAPPRRRVYWDAAEILQTRRDVDPDLALRETRRHLDAALATAWPPAGVEMAVPLSGGVDSGLIAVAAARGGQAARFFTLDVDGPSPGGETASAAETCRRLGIAQEVLTLDRTQFAVTLDTFQAVRPDTPVATPDMLLTHFLACRLRRDGIRVCVFGEGADELGGYPSYVAWDRAYPALRRFGGLPGPLRQLMFRLAPHSRTQLWETALGRAIFPLRHIQGFAEADKRRFWIGPLVPGSYEQAERLLGGIAKSRPDAHLLRLAVLEFKLRLPEFLLARVDDATMSASVEARVPFLDPDLASYALRMTPAVAMRDGQAKHVFKQLFAETVGAARAFQPKRGFGRVLTALLNDFVPEALQREVVPRHGHPLFAFVEPRQLRQMLSPGAPHGRNAYQLWILFALARWLDRPNRFAAR